MPRVEKPSVSETDRAAVIAHVEKYGRSLIDPDFPSLESCFHEQATIFTNYEGAMQGGPIVWLYDLMKRSGGITGLEFKIELLSITASTAVAKIELYREEPAYEVTDFLSLVKRPDGTWTIVSKIFEVYQYNMPQ